ncbi:pyridoxamine 5'-phosphate oxidase family protein [Actinopolymorpha pittospori]
MEALSRMECLTLLREAMVGRVVFIDRALPAVLPAPFVVAGESVVFRTSRASPLARHPDEVVGFEADDMDGGCEWFVSAVGVANVVDGETARSAHLCLPWCDDKDSSCLVRVRLKVVRGHYIPMPNRPRELWPSPTPHTCDRTCPPVCAQE